MKQEPFGNTSLGAGLGLMAMMIGLGIMVYILRKALLLI